MVAERTGPQQVVVVVGSGFAGFECARRLSRLLRKARAGCEVVLISPDDYLLYTPLLPDVAGGVLDPRSIAVSLAESLRGVRLVPGLVETVDLEGHSLEVTDPETGPRTVRWDRLVLTPGSVTRLFDVPGLTEHARGLKTLAEALYLRDHLIGQLDLAAGEPAGVQRDARRTVVVVGASYAGSELVVQLRALADEAARRQGVRASVMRFVLVDTAEHVMPEVGPELGRRAMAVLRARGIDVRLKTTLTRVAADHVVLTDGTTVATRTVAWVTGVTASPLIGRLGLPLDRGRLVVGADLAVPGHPEVFAGGDAAAVPDLTKPGRITPPTAQHATRQGHVLARNVAATLGVGTAKAYRHRDLGLVVDLGPGHAVADPLGLHLSGFPAKVVTRAYHLYALPRGANRLAVAAGYLTDAVTPRPLVNLGLLPDDAATVHTAEPT